MTRRALTAAALAVGVAGAGSPLLAGRDRNKATYTCGTVPETRKQVEGRVNTWSLSALDFTPDSRAAKPLRIRYKSITRLEYGRTPPHRIETADTAPITLPCALKPERKDYYLTIFYKEVPADEAAEETKSQWKAQRDAKARERQDRRDRLEGREIKDRPAPKDDKKRTDLTNRRGQKDRQDPRDESRKTEKDCFAVFELGDGVLRPALRILETRSGKRINYQDAQARRLAR